MKRSFPALAIAVFLGGLSGQAALRGQSGQGSQTPIRGQSGQTPIPTPSDFLKMKIGGDGVLASYEQIVSYFRAVDPLSDRITVEDLGPTTMGHPMLNAVITSPENMKRLEHFRDVNNRLYDQIASYFRAV